jgi:CRP-like cAMP-binding protein
MSIDDDVALLERVPTLRLLGNAALRVLAIGSELQDFSRGTELFRVGDNADCGYVVQRGALRISLDDGSDHEVIAGPGTLVGELALMVAMPRPSSAVALDHTTVIRISRSLFQRVLDSDPDAALRLRDDFAARVSQLASDVMLVGTKLGS